VEIPGIAELFPESWKFLELPSNCWNYGNPWNPSAFSRIGKILGIVEQFLEFVLA